MDQVKAMAVITRTECLLDSVKNHNRDDKKTTSIRHHRDIQGIFSMVLIVFLLAPGLVLSNPVTSGGNAKSCEATKKEVLDRFGFPAKFLLDSPQADQICGEDSCCSSNLEQEMLRESKHQIDAFLRDAISKLSTVLDNRAKKFDSLFKEMMNQSKHDFHDMFHKTYGKIYLQNSDVFSDFFKQLDAYYLKGSVRLSETLEEFFGILYQRMFTVINSQYSFDEKYLDCASDHMVDLKPFGDVPNKLTVQLRRSFVATRTYYKSLAMAAEVAKRMLDLRVDADCEREVTRMHFCGACKGRRGAGACTNYCSAVLEKCLRQHVALSAEWDKIVEALDKVADRLIGPYNIEIVVEPLNIKISEAVMIFQESGAEVSKKIYSFCGKPTLSRRRRSVDDEEDEDDPKFDTKNVHGGGHHAKKRKNKKFEQEDNNASDLEKLIREIKMKVRETRQFWMHLPYQFCNNETVTAPPSASENCWNGTSLGAFTASTQPSSSNKGLPPGRIVSEQIYYLQDFSDKLKKAYHGDEVEIYDDSEDISDGSGSGSGDFEPKEPEPDEDVPRVVINDKDDKDIVEVDENNEIPGADAGSSTGPPDERRKNSYSSGGSEMSLNKALVQYLLPIVLVWFGGAISDLL